MVHSLAAKENGSSERNVELKAGMTVVGSVTAAGTISRLFPVIKGKTSNIHKQIGMELGQCADAHAWDSANSWTNR
jgi:hypothetical protein